MEIRRLEDIEELLKWRREVISNVFGEEASEELMKRNEDYYRRRVADGTHLAFIAISEGREAGCGAVCLTEELPSPDNPSGKCAYLMNIYVRNAFREKGIAHAMVRHLIREAKDRDCGKIYLETTDAGRPVYASLGFHDLPDMMKLQSTETGN